MLKYLAIVLALTSSFAFAKTVEKKKCNPNFNNPITDDRIKFDRCAVSGAMIGILHGEYGDVLCHGSLKDDEKRLVYVFKGEGSDRLSYFEEIEDKFYAGAGEQEAGIQVYKIKIKTLTPKLQKPNKERRSTLTYTRTWQYSEGSDVLKGRLPGVRANFEAPSFFLGDDLTYELEQFAAEVCKN